MPNLQQKENNITVILWFRTQITAFTVKSYWENLACKLTAHAFSLAKRRKDGLFYKAECILDTPAPTTFPFYSQIPGDFRFWSSHNRRSGQLSCSSEGLSGCVHQPGNTVTRLHFCLSPIAVVGSYHFCFRSTAPGCSQMKRKWPNLCPPCTSWVHGQLFFFWVLWFSDWNQNQTFPAAQVPRAGVQTVWAAGSLLVKWVNNSDQLCLPLYFTLELNLAFPLGNKYS